MSESEKPNPPQRGIQEIAADLRAQYARSGSVDQATVRELLGDPMKATVIRAIENKDGLK